MTKKKKNILVGLLLLLLLLFGCFYFLQGKNIPKLNFDTSAEKYQSKIKKPEDWTSTRLAFPGYEDIKIEEGTKLLYIALENPSFNEANFQYTLFLDGKDDAHQLVKTGLIKPGEAVTKVVLPDNLSLGTHKVFIKIRAFAPHDNESKLNGFDTDFNLNVLKKA